MLLLDLYGCGPSGILRVIYFFKLLLDILFIIIPIALIILLTVDFAKMIISNDESMQNKTFKLATKRILYAVLVFFVPTIVSIVNSVLGSLGVEYSKCLNDINIDAINQLAIEEEAIVEAEEAARLELLEKETEKEKEEGEIKDSIADSDVSVASGEGCDGLVYYKDGVFYKPDSSYTNGSPETKGSAPYGYNKYFYSMLSKMIEDASTEGYVIKASDNEYGAWRPLANQQYFYNCYQTQSCNNGNLAAYPGTSNHGWGIASDLSYGNRAAIEWAHDNAINYGLKFTVPSENWHIAPALTKTDNSVVTRCK